MPTFNGTTYIPRVLYALTRIQDYLRSAGIQYGTFPGATFPSFHNAEGKHFKYGHISRKATHAVRRAAPHISERCMDAAMQHIVHNLPFWRAGQTNFDGSCDLAASSASVRVGDLVQTFNARGPHICSVVTALEVLDHEPVIVTTTWKKCGKGYMGSSGGQLYLSEVKPVVCDDICGSILMMLSVSGGAS